MKTKFEKKLNIFFEDVDNTKPRKNINYLFAQDYKYKNKILKQFINTTNIRDCKEIYKKEKYLYELLYNQRRKIYFDLIDHTTTINKSDFDIYITDFIIMINKELDIKTTANDYIILVDDLINISSCHIILKNYSMDYLEQKQFTIFLNSQYTIYADEKVYTKNRLFRLPIKSKIDQKKPLLIYNKDVKFNIHDMLINVTTDTTTLKYNHVEAVTVSKNNKDDKEIKEFDKLNMIYNILPDLNITFFKNANDWKHTTRIIKKHDLYNLNTWAKISIEKLTCSPLKYTYQQNQEFIKSIDTTLIKSSYTLLLQILNKHLPYHAVTTKNYISNELINFIHITYNIEIDEIKQTLFKTPKNGIYKINNIFVDVKSGFIQDDKNNIVNYYYDHINKLNKPNETIFNNIINNISEVTPFIETFKLNDNQNLFISSKWGTGKTSTIIKDIVKHKRTSILFITESNTLNGKLKTDFIKYRFKSHQDKPLHNLSKCENVICSVQSIHRIKNKHFDLVVIDETESIFNAYISNSTFTNKNNKDSSNIKKSFEILTDILKQSTNNIFLDADLSQARIEIIQKMLINKKPTYIKNLQNPFSEYTANLYKEKKQFLSKLYESLEQNKKVIIPSGAVSFVITEYNNIKTKYPNKNILMINKDGVTLHSEKEKYEKRNVLYDGTNFKMDFLNDLEKNIENYYIDVFLYSPTIKTGVSINNEYFNVCFAYGVEKSINNFEFIQMIMRARRLKNKEFNIYTPTYKPYKPNIKLNDIFNNNEIRTKLLKELEDVEFITDNEHFNYIQSLNVSNSINSQQAFTQQILRCLQYHQLKYKYIIETSYDDRLKIHNETKTDIKNDELKKLVDTPFIHYTEFLRLNKIEDLTDTERSQYNKFKIFYQLFNLKDKIEKFENGKDEDEIYYNRMFSKLLKKSKLTDDEILELEKFAYIKDVEKINKNEQILLDKLKIHYKYNDDDIDLYINDGIIDDDIDDDIIYNTTSHNNNISDTETIKFYENKYTDTDDTPKYNNCIDNDYIETDDDIMTNQFIITSDDNNYTNQDDKVDDQLEEINKKSIRDILKEIVNQNKILNIIDYHLNNNTAFYKKYDCYNISKIYKIRYYDKPLIIYKNDTSNTTADNPPLIHKALIKTINLLEYETTNGKKTMTNKQLIKILSDNPDYINTTLYNYTQITQNPEYEFLQYIKIKNDSIITSHYRKVYYVIKQLLILKDISITYKNTNTLRPNDKFIISNTNKLIKYPIKKNIINKSLDEADDKLKKRINSKARNHTKKEISILKSILLNTNYNLKNVVTTQKYNKQYKKMMTYLFNKIQLYNMNSNTTLYKPCINKPTDDLKKRVCSISKYNTENITIKKSNKKQCMPFRFIFKNPMSDDVVNHNKNLIKV